MAVTISEKTLDDLGVLHGEDARRFEENMKNPKPIKLTKKDIESVKEIIEASERED